jgi:hypothetical protein
MRSTWVRLPDADDLGAVSAAPQFPSVTLWASARCVRNHLHRSHACRAQFEESRCNLLSCRPQTVVAFQNQTIDPLAFDAEQQLLPAGGDLHVTEVFIGTLLLGACRRASFAVPAGDRSIHDLPYSRQKLGG